MSSRVRLLPTLIGAAGVLLFLRIGAMAASPEGEKPAEAGAAEAAQPEAGASQGTDESSAKQDAAPKEGSEGAPEAGKEAQAEPAAAPTLMAEAAVPQTKGEADVLERLGERREALDAREKELALREQMLVAAEKQVGVRLNELKQLELKLEALMGKRNEQEEAQLVALVKSYESMKPDDAARIFNRLDRAILVDVASRMKPAKVGLVMAAMEPARAQDLTVLLAKRLKISQAAAAVTPPAPSAPPPPEVPSTAEAPAAVDATPTEPAPQAPAQPNG